MIGRMDQILPGDAIGLPHDFEKWQFPVLGAQINGRITPIRSLTDVEVAVMPMHQKLFLKHDCFHLFKVLAENQREWTKFTEELADPNQHHDGDILLNLNRLLLNYLASAQSVIDHFKKLYKREFRGQPRVKPQPEAAHLTDTEKEAQRQQELVAIAKEEAFETLLRNLRKQNRTFALFEDLRDFTLHSGLPILRSNVSYKGKTKTLVIEAPPAKLLAMETDFRNAWKRSNLKPEDSTINFVVLVSEITKVLRQEIGVFMGQAFGPGLIETHNFYATLGNEAEKATNGGRTVFMEMISNGQPGGFQLSVTKPPVDVYKELGISVRSPILQEIID